MYNGNFKVELGSTAVITLSAISFSGELFRLRKTYACQISIPGLDLWYHFLPCVVSGLLQKSTKTHFHVHLPLSRSASRKKTSLCCAYLNLNSKIAALLLLSPVTYALIRSDKRSMEEVFYSFGSNSVSSLDLVLGQKWLCNFSTNLKRTKNQISYFPVPNYQVSLGFEAIILIKSFHRSPEYLNKLRSSQFRFL